MITKLIHTIDQIIKFGLKPDLTINKNERDLSLEKSLIIIYNLYFDINYEYVNTDYSEYNEHKYADI